MNKIVIRFVGILLILLIIELMSFITWSVLPSGVTGVRAWVKSYEESGLYGNASYLDMELYTQETKNLYGVSGMEYHPYRGYRSKPNYKGRFINTDRDGFRESTQKSLKDDFGEPENVAFFGGSTMYGIGALYDSDTIPSKFSDSVSSIAHDNKKSIKVMNFGMGGYHSFQSVIVLIERLKLGDKIDVVVFYDWVNECLMGSRERTDYAEYATLPTPFIMPSKGQVDIGIRRHKSGVLFDIKERLFDLYTFKIIRTLRNVFINYGNKSIDDKQADVNKGQIDKIVSGYKFNMQVIGALAEQFDFDYYFIMQPSLFTKENLSNYEISSDHLKVKQNVNFEKTCYSAARKELNNNKNFYDLSGIIDTNKTIYLDDHHMSGLGYGKVAEKIVDIISPNLFKQEN